MRVECLSDASCQMGRTDRIHCISLQPFFSFLFPSFFKAPWEWNRMKTEGVLSLSFLFSISQCYSCFPNETIHNIFLRASAESGALGVWGGGIPFCSISHNYILSSLWYRMHSRFATVFWRNFATIWILVVLVFQSWEKECSELPLSLLGITLLSHNNLGYKIKKCHLAESILPFLGLLLLQMELLMNFLRGWWLFVLEIHCSLMNNLPGLSSFEKDNAIKTVHWYM